VVQEFSSITLAAEASPVRRPSVGGTTVSRCELSGQGHTDSDGDRNSHGDSYRQRAIRADPAIRAGGSFRFRLRHSLTLELLEGGARNSPSAAVESDCREASPIQELINSAAGDVEQMRSFDGS
jgi:hypothetical protein